MFDYLIELYLNEKKKRQADPERYDEATVIYRSKTYNTSYGYANYAAAMAIRILVKYPDISPTNKINIVIGCNEFDRKIDKQIMARYFWTALVFLGTILPGHEFDNNSISVDGDDFNNEVGFFTRFGSNSLYEKGFKKELKNELVKDILLDSSLESRPVQKTQATAAVRRREDQEETAARRREDEVIKEKELTRIRTLCWLASNGNLPEIERNNYTTEEINKVISGAFWGDPTLYLGEYNALMIAATYRKLNVVKYFLEEKCADLGIKGGRFKDYTALDCARQKWWFGPSVDLDVVNYLSYCTRNEQQHALFLKQEESKGVFYGEGAATYIPRRQAWTEMLEAAAARNRDRKDEVIRAKELLRIQTLCWLASIGDTEEIRKNHYTTEEINRVISGAFWGDSTFFLGEYNALMIAASYRKLYTIKYFLEEKGADPDIKGGRFKDYTALDCARQKWWFGPSVDLDVGNYLAYSLPGRFDFYGDGNTPLSAWEHMLYDKKLREHYERIEAAHNASLEQIRSKGNLDIYLIQSAKPAPKEKSAQEREQEEYNKGAAYLHYKGYR